MKNIVCYCGTSFEINLKETVNLLENQVISDQIVNNTFMEYHCPSCKKVLRPEFKTNFQGNNINFTMIPEIERNSYLAGTFKLKAQQIVIGFQELREKIIIHNFNFDDRIIEIIKLYILEKISTNIEIKIFFEDFDQDNLIFYIFGLKENETGITKIPEHIYTKIDKNLEERLKDKEIAALLDLPYRSINKINTEVQ